MTPRPLPLFVEMTSGTFDYSSGTFDYDSGKFYYDSGMIYDLFYQTVLRGNPIALWHFARDAIMEEHVIPKHRQWTWEYMFERSVLVSTSGCWNICWRGLCHNKALPVDVEIHV